MSLSLSCIIATFFFIHTYKVYSNAVCCRTFEWIDEYMKLHCAQKLTYKNIMKEKVLFLSGEVSFFSDWIYFNLMSLTMSMGYGEMRRKNWQDKVKLLLTLLKTDSIRRDSKMKKSYRRENPTWISPRYCSYKLYLPNFLT